VNAQNQKKYPQAAQHNAALNRNPELSVNAPEFIPKFSAPLGDWSAHPHHQDAPSQVYPPTPQVFAQNSRPFPPHQQQIPFAGAQQPQPRPSHYVYQNRNFGQNSRPELAGQNQHHNNHHPSYSNNHQQQQQMYMMNQGGGGGGGGGGPHQMGNNNYHGGQGGQRGGIQNRLNFNAQNAEPVALEPMPHKQVRERISGVNDPLLFSSICYNCLFTFIRRRRQNKLHWIT
jgi:hypothetical protein